jgi:UDP-4-amino-4-deoxy-L-arabinose formyltransferase/UDP-glucuronic acid dehydrogenase (UDP-4-keto-hexauronic acid decarboxylating)
VSVVVLAYHEMGCACLRTLLRCGVPVAAVFTHEDDPAEGGWFASVADTARSAGIPTFSPANVNQPRWVEHVAALAPDLLLSFHYRHLLKRALLALPRSGALNLHASLLPRYRGRSPLNWQLACGETESGVTLHHMVGRADAGDIVAQRRVPVDPDDTALALYRKLIRAAEALLERQLPTLLEGRAARSAQDERLATTFRGRTPEDGRIDWKRPAAEIHNLVRAVCRPWPGAFSDVGGGRLLVWRTAVRPAVAGAPALAPGELWRGAGSWFVGSGDGLLELLEFESSVPGGLRSGQRLPALSSGSSAREEGW